MVFFNDVLINLMMVAAIKKAETKDPTLEKKYGIILITGAGQVRTYRVPVRIIGRKRC